jgi:CDP-glycerol glycerophosphotransferase (TagB/SpsB family)
MDVHLFRDERERINELAAQSKHIHVVEPVALGGSLGHYSGEDMEEKASMLAHSDVFLTVYSTMVVEAAVHERPIVSVCLDTPGGWNWPRKYSLPLSQIGGWPTHQRFREAGAGEVALTEDELLAAVNRYLENPTADLEARRRFVREEISFTDGSSGKRTGDYLASLVQGTTT